MRLNVKFTLLLFLLFTGTSFGVPQYQNWCMQGGQRVSTGGVNSQTQVQRTYGIGSNPCTITVFVAGSGGTVKAVLYADRNLTPLANPFFNQNNFTGQYYFYVESGQYDIQIQASGLSTYTLSDQVITDVGITGSGNNTFTGTNAFKNINNIRGCNVFSGSDAGAKIAACIADLPSTGGVADARGLEGSQSSANLITINKANVTVLLPPNGLSCTVGCFSITAQGVSIIGNSSRNTFLVTASPTADVLVTSAITTTLEDVGFRCSSLSRVAGAAVHIAPGGNGFSNRLFIEPCYNGVQMDERTSWNWGPMTLQTTGATPNSAVWNCLICLVGGQGNNVITDTLFTHPILSYDRPALAGALLIDRGTDSITFIDPEVVSTGNCRSTPIDCGTSVVIQNSDSPAAVSPRTIRFFGGIIESTNQNIGVDAQTCKDCLFDGSNIDNSLIGLRVNELHPSALNGNFRFINGRIIQTVQQCVVILGSGGTWIQGNRLGGCSGQLSSSFPAVEAAPNALDFHVDNNMFHPSFNYSFLPTYFLQVDSGGGDQWSFTYNQMLNADRLTANYIDSSTGLNKIIGPNNEESHTELSVLATLKSTIVGVAPISVATTLPAINLNSYLVTYNATTGIQISNAFAQQGVGTADGAGSAVVTLARAYSVAGSYICMIANDNATYAAAVTSYVSGTQFALNVGRPVADGFHFTCLGN